MTIGRIIGAVRGRLLIAASWLACHLPEAPLVPLADLAGDLWYRTTPDRAAQARRNLRRVAVHLAAQDRGSASVRAAATDPRALEHLVRRAYRHAARYYLEVARTPALRAEDLDRRLTLETPDLVDEAFANGPVIFVGLHFGAIELPGLFLASRVGGAVAPMQTIDDAGLQDWFVRTRGAVGLRIVGLREARRQLLDALRAGISVGLVGDRDLTGGGTLVTLFGAPASLPLGPAMLAVESGARPYVVGVRRAGAGAYLGRLETIVVPPDGPRRDRVTTTTQAIATAFQRIVEDAPEQWWAVFFPIWPDLEAAPANDEATAEGAAADSATGSPQVGSATAGERTAT
jgi:lauroyl/myristoyl acyltransferase